LPCIDYFIFDVYMVCDFDWFGALYDNQLLQCNVQPLFCFFSQLRIGYQEWGKSLEASVQKRLTGTGLLDARAKARCTRITKGGFLPFCRVVQIKKDWKQAFQNEDAEAPKPVPDVADSSHQETMNRNSYSFNSEK